MAIWHFKLVLVSRRRVEIFYGGIPVAIPDQDLGNHVFWESGESAQVLEDSLLSVWPEVSSWSNEIRCWGEEDGHQISVIYSSTIVEEVGVKVDARKPCMEFLREICRLGVQYDCLLLIGGNYVLEPNFESLFERFQSSVASRYLADPVGVLKSLPKNSIQQ